MDRQHHRHPNENQNAATAGSNNRKPAPKIRFEYEDDDRFQDYDEDETLEETATESSNLEEDSVMFEPHPDDANVIGADKTSADYYFDSYSHFGNLFFFFFFCL